MSDLPETMQDLPIDPKRKLPIPMMNLRPDDPNDFDGEPTVADFTAIWGPTVLRCGRERLCGICGKPLGYWIAFLGGPNSAASRAYVDPPFHPDCAEAALTLCPHIAIPHHKRAPEHRMSGPTMVPEGFDSSRTEEWVMGITRDYKMDLGRGVFRPAPFRKLRRFGYVDGTLTEVS